MEVSESESSDQETAADDDDSRDASNCVKQPLLRKSEAADGSRLSREARKALKHLHTVDSNVRTVVSAVTSSRTLRRSSRNRAVTRRQRQENIPWWKRWWVLAAATTFIILPIALVVFVKFVSPGS